MKARLILSITILGFLAGGLPGQAEMREFTSPDGRKLTAEIVGYADGVAKLKVESGDIVDVPLSSLSEADREFVDLWATDPARSGEGEDVTMADYLKSVGYGGIDYDFEKFVIIIEIIIDDRPHKFLVNTALPFSYLDGPVADVLGLTVKQIPDTLYSSTGAAVPVGEANLKNFKIGEATIPSRTFRVANLANTGVNAAGVKVDGVIGFDFLREFKVVLDYPEKKFHFLPPSASSSK